MRSLTNNSRKFTKHSPRGTGAGQIQIRNYGDASRLQPEPEERQRPKFLLAKNSEMERRINKTIAELEAELIKTRKRLKEQSGYNEQAMRRDPMHFGRTAPEVKALVIVGENGAERTQCGFEV
eukprot:TRINITY_DN10111_c0_g5_i1.p1 TRINITY_DN10111_c0_g5~~TRINITY_DN10111_c0_g5_i1.p1  ORF type:complete len:123 (+),score=34.59 TRINITY_DN10111_c0_g5_i1:179-547(+)